ncbi:tyrosine-type recombinase/integrase [Pseudomonas zeshuii]|uniref:Tyrosine-type recombinase/integrase n=2 Tax=Pseudomonas luteola TaxID=47886 RepID=A0ABS0FID9_PSELU|nr:tyrosine-type recombinase/integrase [Pseudomonas zeshuii]
MDRRLPILATWKAQIAAVRQQRLERGDAWKERAQKAGSRLAELVEGQTLSAMGLRQSEEMTIEEKRTILQRYFTVMSTAVEEGGLSQETFTSALTDLIKSAEERMHNPATPSREERLDEVLRSKQASKQAAMEIISMSNKLSPAEVVELESIITTPTSYKPRSPITLSRLAAFRAFREKQGLPPKTVDQQESKLQKLAAFLTSEGKPLEFDTVSSWLDSLELSSKTKAQYLLAGSVFWKWAMKYEDQWRKDFKDKVNPFLDHDLPQARGKQASEGRRRAFTKEEVERLFTASSGVLRDLIELGAYTGARIEEICQLKADHIVKVDGFDCFKIEDSKTVAGIRDIPVHPSLAPLIDRLTSKSKDGYLLPSSGGNQYGIRSDSLSKAFGRLKTSLGFGPQHVFHSVRKTFITQLQRADVPGVTIASIVGHETGTITYDVYSAGASTEQKLKAIKCIEFAFNN